jgi:acyl transferase domain-containing protein
MWGAVDLAIPIPLERWDVDHGTGAAPEVTQTNILRFAALADGIDRFDAAAFRLGPAESAAMDPQQRILLEQVHAALQVCLIRHTVLPSSALQTRSQSWQPI